MVGRWHFVLNLFFLRAGTVVHFQGCVRKYGLFKKSTVALVTRRIHGAGIFTYMKTIKINQMYHTWMVWVMFGIPKVGRIIRGFHGDQSGGTWGVAP